MAFDNVRLPEDVERGVEGGPRFKTTIVPLGNGGEQRNAEWSRERYEGDVSYGLAEKAEYIDTVIAFFYARRGKARGFRFKDWSDYQAVDTPIGVGNGVATTFQLVKRYSSGGVNFDRKITRVVAGTLTVKVAGVPTVAWTVNNDTGLLTFTAAVANAAAITASFEFDLPVRFDTDNLPVVAETETTIEIGSLPIIGIKE